MGINRAAGPKKLRYKAGVARLVAGVSLLISAVLTLTACGYSLIGPSIHASSRVSPSLTATGAFYEMHLGGGPTQLGGAREIYLNSVGYDSSKEPIASVWMGLRGTPGSTPTPDFALHVGESRTVAGVGTVTLVSIDSGLGGSVVEVLIDLDD